MVFNIKNSVYFFIIFFLISFSGKSQVQLVINEVTQGYSGSQEYVELVVVGTPTCNAIPTYDIRNYYIDDNNGTFGVGAGTGIADGCIRLSNDPLWSSIPAGTIILFYNDADKNPDIPPDDLSMTDGNCTLVIPISNCTLIEVNTTQPSIATSTYPTTLTACGNWNNIAMANGGDSFHTLDASGNVIHAVSWGNNTLNNIIYFAPSQAGLVCAMQNSTDNNPALQANWTSSTVNAVTQTPGAPNNAANATWIHSMNNSCTALTALTTPITPTNAGCSCNGSATVNASGAIGPYTYSWSPSGGTSATASSLCAGNYTVSVTSSNGCVNTTTVAISSTSPLSSTITASNVNCNGASTGSATVAVSGGSGSYTYTWSPSGGNSTSASGLSANTYTVNFHDGAGCAGSNTVSVTQPASALTATANVTANVNCNGGSTGSATVAASGGTSGYTYTWSPSGGNATTVSGLGAGSYTVNITDSKGCTAAQTINITQPAAALTATANVTANVNCNSGSTGSATVAASGGTAGYTYTWSPSGGNTTTASSLAAGSYTVNITDSKGCVTSNTIAITQPTSALTATANVIANENCNGGSTGSATIGASGGTAGYTYTWSPSGGNATTASSLVAGSYTVNITDSKGCTTAQTISITQPTVLTASASVTANVNCNGGSTGSATVAASGGTAGYTYTWSPSGGNTTTASGLSAGNYTVNITDTKGCTATKTVSVTQPAAALSAAIASNNVNCNGTSTGSSTVTASGGTAGYTYTWSPSGGNTTVASSLGAGSYTVNITDSKGCTVSQTVTITQPASVLTTTVSVTANVNCNGGSTGSATVAASGGTAGYTYTWSPSGGNATTASSLSAGSYTVNITDTKGCTASNTVSITQPAILTATANVIANVNCNGGSTGSATIAASGGTAGYTYTWSPSGGNTTTASNLGAGSYTVNITDSKGCTATKTVSITQPAVLTATASVTANVNCNGGSTGSATVAVSGGTAGYTYTWSPSGGNTATASNLGAGSYTVNITDTKGCTTSNTISVTQPTAITLTVSSTQATCGSSNGSAFVNAIGGAGSYTYSWTPSGGTGTTASGLAAGNYTIIVTDGSGCTKTGNTTVTNAGGPTGSVTSSSVTCYSGSTGTATVVPSGGTGPYTYTWSPSGGNNANASGLSAGNYTVTISDFNNCISTATVAVTQPVTYSASVTTSSVNCNGASTGSATVTASGGTSGYTYSWSPSGGTSANASGLNAGNYTITVTDTHNCVISNTVTVTQPAPLSATTTITNADCNGASTGSSTVSVSGGTSGYTYSWTPSGGTNTTASGLSAGNYSVTITDINNCIITNTISVSQPSAITATVTNSPANCGASNGTAIVTAVGGTGAYSYLWTPSGGTGATASGLSAGNYNVMIIDANGCSQTANTSVTNTGGPTASISSTSLTCNGNNNGTATVTPSGGVGPYTYTWSPSGGNTANASGLNAGNYTVTIADANGCLGISNVTIAEPAILTATTNVSNVNCNGTSTGSSTVTVSGGTSAYTYSWSPSGGTNSTASSLSAANYTVTVTDANNCITTNSITISQPAPIVLTSTVTNVTCSAGSDGSVSVNAIGGTGSYTYSWSPSGGTNANASGLSAGNYTINVLDQNGCMQTASVTVNDGMSPITPTATTSVYCEGQTINPLTATGSGGTINWYSDAGLVNQIGTGNSFTPSPTPTTTTVYYITETNGNGCKSPVGTDTVKITPTPTTPTTMTNVYCQGQVINPLSSNSIGGTITWYSDAGLTNQIGTGNLYIPIPTPTATTVYYVVSISSNNCKSGVGTDTIKVNPIPSVTGGVADTAKCGNANGGINGVIVNGGTPNYNYQWTNTSTGNVVGNQLNLSNAVAGTYSLLVTDANGCTATSVNNFTVVSTASVVAAFTPSTLQGETPVAVTFSNTSTGATNYIWNFGDSSPISTQQNTSYTYNVAGTYTVMLIATNGNCSDTTYKIIQVDVNTVLIIPNIYSPNGDGINDEFFITCKGIKNLQCVIFNRWGQEVYSLNAPDQVWDGIMNNGNPASEGTYYYIIEATGYDGKSYKDHGPLTLVK